MRVDAVIPVRRSRTSLAGVVLVLVVEATRRGSAAVEAFVHHRTSSSSSSSSSSSYHQYPHRGGRRVFSPATTRRATASSTVPSVSGGEADRSFCLGVDLEKNGQARASAAAFHEAATLYQCFLDSCGSSRTNEFDHVTDLTPEACRTILAYACVRLAHLSHDALGDSKAAIRLYKDATVIDARPSSVSFHGMGVSVEASHGDLCEAVSAYREALRLTPHKAKVQFDLAVALERLGRTEESDRVMERLRRSEAPVSCLVDSWGYVRWHTRKIKRVDLNLHRGTRAVLQIGLDAAAPLLLRGGFVCEFGVGSGRSIRMLRETLPLDVPIHGFDTFEGIPTSWGDEPAGSYSTGGVAPVVADGGDVTFHKGLFSDTIKEFLRKADHQEEDMGRQRRPLAFANVDCDLYTSTNDVLEGWANRIVSGTVLVFDEYLCHPTWRQDEFRSWRECCKRFGWQYDYLAFSLTTKQAVVQVR